MKHFLILIGLLFPVVLVTGQNQNLIQKIHQKLAVAEGEDRYDLLNDLAWEHRFAAPDSTIYYSNLAYAYGKKIDVQKGLARSVNVIGVAFNYKGERLLAYEHYTKALQIANAQNDSVQIAHSNNNIGRLFFEQGLLSRSYECYIRAKEIFQNINDSSGEAYALQSLANLYKTQRDYKKSEETFLKAYEIRRALGNPRDVMSAFVYLGRLHVDVNNWDKSIYYLKRADSIGNVIRDEINLAEIKTYLAEGYLNKGMLKEAEQISREAVQVIEKANNQRMKPQAYHIMGQILMRKSETAKAKQFFTASLEVASLMKDLNSQMRAHHDLWKVSELQHNENDRLKHMNEYLLLKDSVKDLDLARQIERLQFELEIHKKEQENAVLKAEDAANEAVLKRQKLQNIGLILIVLLMGTLGVLLWALNKRSKEANIKLLKQNEEIQKQREEILQQNEKLSRRNQQLSELNHEKDTLMSIVAHDLKSPLNRIKGIVDLMELEGGLSEDQKVYVRMTRDATRAGLDLITDLLDVHMLEENVQPATTTFDISLFLLNKVKEFQPTADTKQIHLYITRVSNEMVSTDVDYLSRIMDNLLSNAIKFSERGSTIVVAAGRLVDEFWISVKDQGPGFSGRDKEMLYQKFKKLSARPTAGETSNGLGLAIVKTLIDRLKGKIELNSEAGKGSEFVIRIPVAIVAQPVTAKQS